MTKQTKNSLTVLDKVAKLKNNISISKQLQLIEQIAQEGEIGQEALLELLIKRRVIEKIDISYLDGLLFETINSTHLEKIKKKLDNYFENGLIDLTSSSQDHYQPLQKLLMCQNFQEADKLTQVNLCNLAGLGKNSKRNWLYFTDITLIPTEDLLTIDILWRIYSRGKFGFSIQRQIWLSNDCNWEKFWNKIGWKDEGVAHRYPNEFIWNTNAPYGHLPLFNQLRGVQVLHSLFEHIAWK